MTYEQDILTQPQALEQAVRGFDATELRKLAQRLASGQFDRVLIVGMGASLYAGYPVWLRLAGAGVPAIWMDAAELLHHVPGIVSPRTLLWLISQSGRSVEISSLLDWKKVQKPAALVATVNDMDSPLMKAADYCLPIRAEPEATVSTRTYLNSLAIGQLAANVVLGLDVEPRRSDLLRTAEALKHYLAEWDDLKARLTQLVGFPKRLVLLGRGASLGSAHAGALVLGEAAKFLAAAFEAGEFRHGPLEMAGSELTALVFEGPAETRDLNLRMLGELRDAGTHAYGIGTSEGEWQIGIPEVPAIGLPMAEILPMQALSVVLAEAAGIKPGDFIRIGKVTLRE